MSTRSCVPLGLLCVFCLFAQQSQLATAVPKIISVAGTFHPSNAMPAAPVESVTLSIYAEERGGPPLWSETQNIDLDSQGRYSALMGSSLPDGIPAGLFGSGEPRWLGVRINRPGEIEQPRTLLVSVPYALKAANAETLGGRPASAYLLAAGNASSVQHPTASSTASGAINGLRPTITSGAANCLSLFTNTTDLGCSTMWQSGSSIGIGTSSPTSPLTVQKGAGAGLVTDSNAVAQFTSSTNAANFWFAAPAPLGGGSNITIGFAPGGTIASGLLYNIPNNYLALTHNAGGSTASDLVVSSSGNVGIGTNSPTSTLVVQRSAGAGVVSDSNAVTQFTSSGNATNFWFNAPMAASGGTNMTIGFATGGNIRSGLLYNIPNNYIALTHAGAASSATDLVVSASGNVGIGTSTPSATLDVAGDLNVSGTLRLQGQPAVLISATAGNTVLGALALGQNATGANNTATGYNALAFNNTGGYNTASGGYTLSANTKGNYNTAIGYGALQSNAVGSYSTATGYRALSVSNGAGYNTADGALALSTTTIGQNNTATGYSALGSNTIGSQNTAAGYEALYSNTAGNSNTATGFNALYLTTGTNNVAIGYQAGYFVSAGNNNIHIGHAGTSSDNATIRIGTPGTQYAFFAAGIRGVTTGSDDTMPVYIDVNGQLGTISSSQRYKDDIQDMGDATQGLLRLRPVTFRYKQSFGDGSKPIQYGLIAEEVEKVYPELVVHSADGQIESVKYQVLGAMLLNEFQRQEATITLQKRQIDAQNEQIRGLRGELEELKTALAALAKQGTR